MLSMIKVALALDFILDFEIYSCGFPLLYSLFELFVHASQIVVDLLTSVFAKAPEAPSPGGAGAEPLLHLVSLILGP